MIKKLGVRKNISSKLSQGFLLSFCLIISSINLSFSSDLNQNLESYRKELELTLESKVNSIFKMEDRIVINVKAVEGKPEIKVPDKSDKKDEARDPSSDLGYLDIPFDDAQSVMNRSEVEEKRLHIDSLSILARVPVEMKDDQIAQLKEVLGEALPLIKNDIQVTKFNPIKKASDSKELLRALLFLVAALGSATILCVGIYLIARAMKQTSKTIADEMKSSRNESQANQSSQLSKANGLNQNAAGGPKGDGDGGGTPKVSRALMDFSKNVRIFSQFSTEFPMTVVQTLGSSQGDMPGLRWLLPLLGSDARDHLTQSLSPSHVEQMQVLDLSVDAAAASGKMDYPEWLQGFTQRLVLKKLQGDSKLLQLVGVEKATVLYSVKSSQLLQVAGQLDTPLAWRILTEFIPKKDLENFILKSDQSIWDKLLQENSGLDQAEVIQTADQIIEAAQKVPEAEQRERDQKDYYKRYLTDPIIKALSLKTPGEDDDLLDTIRSRTTVLAELIDESIWTTRMLTRIPENYLTKVFKDLAINQKAALVGGLPDHYTSRFVEFLPQGNSREIFLDMVKRIKNSKSTADRESSYFMVRNFLSMLREHSFQGKFELLVADGSDSTQKPKLVDEVTQSDLSADSSEDAQRKAA